MNRLKIVLIATVLSTSTLYAQQTQLKRMAVISDVHLMAPSLLQHKGAAFNSYIANDRKMFVEGTELLACKLFAISKIFPNFVTKLCMTVTL